MGGALRLQSRGRLRLEPSGCTAFPPACRPPGRIRHAHVTRTTFRAQRLSAAGRDSFATFRQIGVLDPAMRFTHSHPGPANPVLDLGPSSLAQPSPVVTGVLSGSASEPRQRDLRATLPGPLPQQCVARRNHRRGGVQCRDRARDLPSCSAKCGPGTKQACQRLRKSRVRRS